MYLMFVDESGDHGLANSPTRYFILTGVVVHELQWREYSERILGFRRRMRTGFGLKLRDEIHAAALVNKPGDLLRIKRHDRLTIIREFAQEIAEMHELSIINVVVDKSNKSAGYDVFTHAWTALIQRFENTIEKRNFRGVSNDQERGMIFPDHANDKALTRLMRKMMILNPISNQQPVGDGFRNLALSRIIEDPNFRVSQQSHWIQAADVCAFLLYQSLEPNSYMRKNYGQNYFNKLDAILCKVASPRDPLGIVRLKQV